MAYIPAMKLLVRAIHLSLQPIGLYFGSISRDALVWSLSGCLVTLFCSQQFGQLQQVAPRHPIMLWFSKLRRDGNEMNHVLRKQATGGKAN
ncbi:unnamed protein product [Prunus armeniaca]|uniref:Uncharacterized protein n=1 Tax=Prunus armeniaca TaxID=36596 RepID=A0A6J5XF05_PRUAR|nr:unnamed protein product [Prunus armeniaca]CAB4311207.1 unnamed protein product [Prunus armeniaca]